MTRKGSTEFAYQPLCRRHLDEPLAEIRVHEPIGFNDEVKEFLRCAEPDIVRHAHTYWMCDLPHVHRAIEACFPSAQELFLAGPPKPYSDFWIASHRSIELLPGEFQEFLAEGASFRCSVEGHRFVLVFVDQSFREEPFVEFSLIGWRCHADWIRSKVKALNAWMKNHDHYLCGQALKADGTLLQLGRRLTWDDVVLAGNVRSTLECNIEKVLELRDHFLAMGIPQRRGILLHGPPGTGKTMIGKVLAGMGIATFVLFTAGDIDRSSIREAFDLARKLRPTILFIEDLDLIAVDRRSRCDYRLLGELLTQMDGVHENDGVIVVATTNDLQAIEPALADRPSRFDVVLEVGLPGEAQRRGILERHIGGIVDTDTLQKLAESTSGHSGAHVREVAYQLVQEAILAQDGHPVPRQTLSSASVRRALCRITGKRDQVGFALGRT